MTFKIRPLNEMIPIIMKAVEEDRMADQIHRLQEQVEFERASLRSAFDELLKRDNEIERLREALKVFADNVKETNIGIDENWTKTVYPLKAENQRLRDMLKKLTDFEFYFDGSNSDDLMKLMDEARKALGGKE